MSLKLTHKITIAFSLALALTTALLTSISYFRVEGQTQVSIAEHTSSYNRLASQDISRWLEAKRDGISALTAAIEKTDTDDDILRHLQQAQEASGFDLTYLGLESGDMYRNKGLNTVAGYDPRIRSWYKLAKSSREVVVTEPFIGASTGLLTITIAKALYRNGEFLGVIGASVNLQTLTGDITDMAVPGDGFAFLLSKKGTIVAHPSENLRNKPYQELGADMPINDIVNQTSNQQLEDVLINGEVYLVSSAPVSGSNWTLVMVGQEQVLLEPIKQTTYFLVVLAVVMIVIVVLISMPLIQALLSNLIKVSDALKDISKGGGDLTQRIKVRSRDEVGLLAENFNLFVDELQNLLVKVQEVTEQVNSQASIASESATQRALRASSQQDEVTMVATAVTEMASATQEIANNSEQTANASSESVKISARGQKVAVTCQNSISDLAGQVNDAMDIISELNHHGQEINSIVNTISDIAEQTNLLALNAAIEAARAGEQGRGFAVVADEVRVLSQRTHKSTEEITAMISTLQSTTKQAVNVMDECHQLAQTSVADAKNASDSFEEISGAISNISDMSTQIATAAEEQTSVTDEIGRNTDAIREVAVEFMTESDRGTQQAGELTALADQLRRLLGQFKLS